MDDKKKKTRSDLLRELESIKGLLADEDIPVLQEVFAPHAKSEDAGKKESPNKLNREELAALKSAYQSLLADAEQFTAEHPRARSSTPPTNPRATSSPTEESDRNPQGAQDTRPTDEHLSANPAADTAYTEENYSLDLGPEPAANADNKARPISDQKTADNSVLPGQQKLFKSGSATQREKQQALLNSYGENPFLPQHIRERLRGNRMDFNTETTVDKNNLTEKKEPAPVSSEDSRSRRQNLIEDLVQEVLPQLESQLRAQLRQMSEEQIKALLIEKQKDSGTSEQV